MIKNKDFSQIIKKIKLLVSDVDGVLTDGKILIHSDNTESKFFNVEDATGAALAFYGNLPIALISGRFSNATTIRAKELNITYCYQGVLNKRKKIYELMKRYSVSLNEIAYIGDSLVDVPVLEEVGFPITVPNAHESAKKVALYQTIKSGGEGVLFEVVEKIFSEQNKYVEVLNIMKRKKFD